MFGSLSTGLALENSDMDLVVIGLKIGDQNDAIEHIRNLKKFFEESEYFRDINAIEGASIPVLKLEADLQKVRKNENPTNKQKVESKMRFLQIDITFEDQKRVKSDLFWEDSEWDHPKVHHMGIKSLHLIKTYLQDYVHLKEMTLWVKKLLSVKGLNSPYTGGMSSYGVVIMIVAYMNFFSLQNAWINISQLLMHFFEFYGSKFDERKVGILVSRGGSYYPFNSVSEHPIVIKDPLNIENNIGKWTYRISDIKSAFLEASNILDYEKQNFNQITEEEILKQEELLEKGSGECIERMYYLSKILKADNIDKFLQ